MILIVTKFIENNVLSEDLSEKDSEYYWLENFLKHELQIGSFLTFFCISSLGIFGAL